jgi:2,3-dihydroxybenzoate decarboxylase
MIETVAIEEAVLHPDFTELSTRYTGGHTPIVDALCDIHGKRLTTMTKEGNEFQVLSLTSPGPQGETDYKKVVPAVGNANGRARNWLVCATIGLRRK